MVVFVVKRYAVREAKKWRYAVRNAKIERYAVRKGGGGCHPHCKVRLFWAEVFLQVDWGLSKNK